MARKKHSKKEIEKALQYAEAHGWIVEEGGKSAHAFGKMFCPTNSKCRGGHFCSKSIWSSPASNENHAREIRQIVDKCGDT